MTDYKTIAELKNFIVLDKYTREWQVTAQTGKQLLQKSTTTAADGKTYQVEHYNWIPSSRSEMGHIY